MTLGWRFFIHSIRQLLLNIGPALRISLLPYLIFLAVYLSIGQPAMVSIALMQDDQALLEENFGSIFLSILTLGLVAAICFIWVAVAWHRYVLLEEEPGPFFARMQRGPMMAYLAASVRLFLVVFLFAILISVVVSILGGILFVFPMLGILIFTFGSVVLSAFILGLSMILPAAALQDPIPLAQARQTAWANLGPILVLSLLITLLNSIPQILTGTPLGPVVNSVSYQLPSQWLITMLSISVATTLYGYFIQGRELVV